MAPRTTSSTSRSARSAARTPRALSTRRHAAPAPKKAEAHPTESRHYDVKDLHADYTRTYGMFMKALAVGILGALAYFFVMIVYLGAKGHTPTDDYVREFGSRIQYDYKGLRLPEYDDPSLLDAKKPATPTH